MTNFDAIQRPLKLNYCAIMPDGSWQTVVDGKVVYDSSVSPFKERLAKLFPPAVEGEWAFTDITDTTVTEVKR